MALVRKYLTIDNLYLHKESTEDIYVLLINILSLPHSVDEVIRIFDYLNPANLEYYVRLNISRALALACQDADTRLVEKMLASKYHWNPNISYYYPYVNASSLDLLLKNNTMCLDEATFRCAFVGNHDLFVSFLRHFQGVSCQRETPELGTWEWMSRVIAKYPVSKVNYKHLVCFYDSQIIIKEPK